MDDTDYKIFEDNWLSFSKDLTDGLHVKGSVSYHADKPAELAYHGSVQVIMKDKVIVPAQFFIEWATEEKALEELKQVINNSARIASAYVILDSEAELLHQAMDEAIQTLQSIQRMLTTPEGRQIATLNRVIANKLGNVSNSVEYRAVYGLSTLVEATKAPAKKEVAKEPKPFNTLKKATFSPTSRPSFGK